MKRKKINWKRKILSNVRQQFEKHEAEQREEFRLINANAKFIEFKTRKNVNMEKFFFIPKIKPNWNFGGSKNAIAVYPVLCSQADFRQEKWYHISRENIAKLAGVSTVSVDKGIAELQNMNLKISSDKKVIETPLLRRKMVQAGKKRYCEYLPGFFRPEIDGIMPSQWQGNYFSFHTCIIDLGIWADLHRNAKALYLTMRSVAWFDNQLYQRLENIWIPDLKDAYEEGNDELAKQAFKDRKWEVVDMALKELFAMAGIPYRNTKQLINELERAGLISRLDLQKSVFKVWIKPNTHKMILNSVTV